MLTKSQSKTTSRISLEAQTFIGLFCRADLSTSEITYVNKVINLALRGVASGNGVNRSELSDLLRNAKESDFLDHCLVKLVACHR